ncbi:hypothetical protein CPter91_0392 [Collimonas pratensis]|uniref:Uncharacterized protein n=1 Tax=Collimonas pratensis TaxID=279113 RepID=A0A127PYC4_9BURK|nr:hypothetical protein CPter91_0392 [Collimonas pratensis]
MQQCEPGAPLWGEFTVAVRVEPACAQSCLLNFSLSTGALTNRKSGMAFTDEI